MNSRMRRIYAKVPEIACKGLCHQACGPIPLLGPEKRLVNQCGAERAFAFGRFTVISDEEATCPFLTDEKRCSIYEERPLICRLYGVVEGMVCPHGCTPEVPMLDRRSDALQKEMEKA